MPNTGNTQQQINYGAAANDGLGDPLRTAFIKTDENFDNIWLAGPVGSNITITNNTIQVNDTNGNLVLQPNATGIIQTRGSLQSYANNLHYLGTANLRYLGGFFGPVGLDVTGNITAGNISTGGFSTDLLTTSGLTVNGDAQITGNLRVQGDTIQVGNIITDTLTIQLANTAANAVQANGAGITVGLNDNIATLLYDSAGDIWTTNIGWTVSGNIDAAYFTGNGSQLTGMYDNANVADYLPTFTGNLSGGNLLISSAGNAWTISENTITAPSGGIWRSLINTKDDFITSAANGFINLQSLYFDGNIASELHLEHGVAQIRVADAPFKDWTFRSTGTLEAPGNIDMAGNLNATNTVFAENLDITKTGNTWYWNGSLMLSPAGGSWFSNPDVQEEYISSGVDGYLSLQSLNPGPGFDVASEVKLEHGKVRIGVYNGSNYEWDFNVDGTMGVPGNVTTPGNITADYFIGDGSQLTGITVVAGSNTQVQFNDDGALGADPDFYFVKATNTLVVNGELNEHSVELGAQGFTDLNANVIAQVTGNANSYTQINFQNINSGNRATTDYVATAAFGTDSTFFVNMGIASNDYDNTNPNNSLGTSLYPQDSYLYSQGGNTLGGSGGNLVVGSNEPGGVVRIIADGSNDANIVATFSNIGIDVKGNILPVANGVYSLGDSTHYWSNLWVANNTIYIGGVPLGVTGNVLTVDGQPVLSNDGDSDITTTGNLAVNAILTDGYFYANGAPFVSGGGSIGNLEVTGTTIGIAPGAPETAIAIGNSAAGLSVLPDTNNPIVKLYASTSDSSFFNSGGDFSTGTYVAGGSGGIITLNDATTVEQYLNNLSGPYTIVSVTVNGTDTVPWDGGGWGGGTVTINTTVPPTVDPTNVTSIVYNLVYENKFLLDVDDGSFGIYIGDNNFDIQSVRDVRITAGDDFSIESNDILDLRSRSTTPGDGIRLISDYSNAGYSWLFENNGNLSAPGAITTTGDITANSFIGDGSQLTGLPASYGNADVATFLADFGSNAISTTGNITAGNLIGNISITGNVTGTSANVTLVAGAYSAVFDNTGVATFPGDLKGDILVSTNSAGDEGGEINLAIPVTNTTLTGSVTVDVYQDRFRVFQGGSSRGAYIDLAKAPGGVGGELMWKVSGVVNAGTFVTLDNLKVTVASSGNRGLSVAAVSGSFYANIGAWYGGSGGVGGTSVNNLSVTTTPSVSLFDWNFVAEGNTAQYTIYDKTNSRMYRVTMMIGPAYLDNFISIERLY